MMWLYYMYDIIIVIIVIQVKNLLPRGCDVVLSGSAVSSGSGGVATIIK